MKKQSSLYTFTCALILTTALISPTALLPQETQKKPLQEFGLAKAFNLGEPINTSLGEFAPTISADGKTLIFESDRDKRYDWKLYITHKTETGWTQPLRLDNVNSEEWDGAPFLTYDQNYLIISSERAGGLGDLDIWISQRLGNSWSKPLNMGEPINTSGYDAFASLSSDGKTLYFMRRPSNKSNCDEGDLYFSIKENEGWSYPQKLPYPINSDYCDDFPVILPDGKTLIFSSNRTGGFGGHDLYKSERQENGSWSEPVNLGSFINTPADDQLVSISASGDMMYFSSGGSLTPDLFSVPIPPAVRPTTVITVSGTVKNAKNPSQPLFAKITIIDVETSKDTTVVESNKTDGKYIVILNKGKVYDVSASSAGYTFYSAKFDLTALEAYKEVTRDILLEPIATGTKIVLNNIYFALDSYQLLEESKFELQRAAKLMQDNPTMQVEISAHTDSTGSHEYNLELSRQRAGSVVEYLTSHNIEKGRLLAKGYGETLPIADNATEEGRQQNRRVEFKILRMDLSAER